MIITQRTADIFLWRVHRADRSPVNGSREVTNPVRRDRVLMIRYEASTEIELPLLKTAESFAYSFVFLDHSVAGPSRTAGACSGGAPS